VEGDDHGEAYTAIMRGVGLSPEIPKFAEAEAFTVVEGKMCGAVMRGADAPPGSKATSRRKGSRRNLGDLTPDHRPKGRPGPHREGEEPKPMMHGREKSGPVVVATKRANKAERSAAESVERRAGTEGNARQDGTLRTLSRDGASHGLDRVRQASQGVSPSHTREGAACGKAGCTDLCGGRSVMGVPTAIRKAHKAARRRSAAN